MATPCPFCTLGKERILFGTEHCLVFLDGYPLTEGHTLIIPKRHVLSAFDLNEGEFADLWTTVRNVRRRLIDDYRPDAFNIGINDGPEAGQTVPHVHVHVIPRRKGDVSDPQGGIRWIIPGKAKYW